MRTQCVSFFSASLEQELKKPSSFFYFSFWDRRFAHECITFTFSKVIQVPGLPENIKKCQVNLLLKLGSIMIYIPRMNDSPYIT